MRSQDIESFSSLMLVKSTELTFIFLNFLNIIFFILLISPQIFKKLSNYNKNIEQVE